MSSKMVRRTKWEYSESTEVYSEVGNWYTWGGEGGKRYTILIERKELC